MAAISRGQFPSRPAPQSRLSVTVKRKRVGHVNSASVPTARMLEHKLRDNAADFSRASDTDPATGESTIKHRLAPLPVYRLARTSPRPWPSKIQRGGFPKEPASFAFQTARDDALAGTRNCDSNHFR